jgi:sugar fermentation stimulation protein A
MKEVLYFEPNIKMHKEFADALKKAKEYGVNVLAVDCEVTEDSINISDYVEVRI